MATQNNANPKKPQTGKKVCMLAYSFYESDNRIMRYTQALVERGDEVDVIALGSDEKQPAFEVVDGVGVIASNAGCETKGANIHIFGV